MTGLPAFGLDPISGIRQISAGGAHSCALAASGGLKCWGDNRDAQLGDGTLTIRHSPVPVTDLASDVAAVSAGSGYTCALTVSGGVKCWGGNLYGGLGDGSTTRRLAPTDVTGLTSGVRAISVGSLHACALTTAGAAKCWGWNLYGQLGNGAILDGATPRPTDVSGLQSGVAAISAGSYHACALSTEGTVKCWGANLYGQMGDGTTTNRPAPIDVAGIGGRVAAISAGEWHTCALTAAGGVKCWGLNNAGQLGDGTTTNRYLPVDVAGLSSGVAAVAASSARTCALTTAGAVKCWGSNRIGELGDGTTTSRLTPVNVVGLATGVTAVTTGSAGHTCALTSAGGVKCWGYNFYGQVGDNTTTNRLTPVDVLDVASLNYTALWWNAAENGWGVNFTHQGNNVFGTLFTYDANRAPMWLVMSGGSLQADGVTFSGELYRTTGPAFNANPFTPIGPANYTRVGTMSATFSGANSGTLNYTVNGVAVTKSIQRLVYGTRAANCVPTTGSRAGSANYQDLWWNAAEGGWGVNVTHQDNILFATLFTYDASGRDLWLVMSGGVRQADGSYQGTIYRSSGPPFNASPFTPITEANLTPVGMMRFVFADGERGTLDYTVNGISVTKAITRLVFSSPVPACS